MFAEAADDLMHDPLLFPPAQLVSAPQDVFDVMRAQVDPCLFEQSLVRYNSCDTCKQPGMTKRGRKIRMTCASS